jgi:hypothetical protein
MEGIASEHSEGLEYPLVYAAHHAAGVALGDMGVARDCAKGAVAQHVVQVAGQRQVLTRRGGPTQRAAPAEGKAGIGGNDAAIWRGMGTDLQPAP